MTINLLKPDLDSQHVVQAQAAIGEPLEGEGQEVVGHVVRQAAVAQPAAHERQHVLYQRLVGRVVSGLTAQEHHGQQLDLSAGASALAWKPLQVPGLDATGIKFKLQISNSNIRVQFQMSELNLNFQSSNSNETGQV